MKGTYQEIASKYKLGNSSFHSFTGGHWGDGLAISELNNSSSENFAGYIRT